MRIREVSIANALMVASLVAILLPSPAFSTDSIVAPRRAPSLFATDIFGLMALIPSGLTYCPIPPGWVGSNHGTELYLVAPTGCHREMGYSSSDRGPLNSVPTISIFYAYNVPELELPGYEGPPRNAEELRQLECDQPYLPLPDGLTLFGKPAVGCRYDRGDEVKIRLVQLYRLEPSNQRKTGEPPDCELEVTLYSSRKRLAEDLRIFGAITKSFALCTPAEDKATTERPRCPQQNYW